jgi:LPXTG-site transpeptidase (sortase) family protein
VSPPATSAAGSRVADPGGSVARPGPPAVTTPTPNYDRQMPDPVRLLVPAIGLSAPVLPLGLNSDGTLQVPKSFSQAGWFTEGPEPGERGAAVIAGHFDAKSGPGVFYRLRALRRGDLITVAVRGGAKVKFAVSSTLAVRKTRFPTSLVYRRTPRPTLRLITCDGAFDSSTGHYVDNYIVFATLIGGT